MIYCDTSLLISALTTETTSRLAQEWLYVQNFAGLAISPWVDTEFASAVAIKRRRGDLNTSESAKVIVEWRWLRRSFHIEGISDRHFVAATALVGDPRIRLGGGDALHLAVAQDCGFDLATLDTDLTTAAASVSVKALNPLQP